MNARLCQIINDHHSNVAEIARLLGVARRSVHRWINGSQEPMTKYLRRIAEFWPDVDLHWLITGEKK
jgi:transcriptional regulator with XRE-family HTH domain